MQGDQLKQLNRRLFLKDHSKGMAGIYALSIATGVPMPLLAQTPYALAQQRNLDESTMPCLIFVSCRDGMRPNDFNICKNEQPQFMDRDWTDDDYVEVAHSSTDVRLYPPGIRPLARYGDRIAIVSGVRSGSIDHGEGNRLTTSNAMTSGEASSFHALFGRSFEGSVPEIAMRRTAPLLNGRSGSGLSTSQILASVKIPGLPSETLRDRIWRFRHEFHKGVLAKLSVGNRRVLERYFENNGSFESVARKVDRLSGRSPPKDNFAGQLETVRLLSGLGICRSFMIELPGSFDSHGSNQSRHAAGIEAAMITLAQSLAEWERAEELDNVCVAIGTAFGRNPSYNSARGTDHLPSNNHYTFIGKPFRPGYYGRTTNTQRTRRLVTAWAVDPDTGRPKDAPGTIDGETVALTPANVLAGALGCLGVPARRVRQCFPDVMPVNFLRAPS